ncbi:MAG: HAMP domain-containing histidine kinase [Gemmatimonadaceae bacterium]|nr:HAMP domain-containing histidine kinase [Gemmatimonadaceae bacterium]
MYANAAFLAIADFDAELGVGRPIAIAFKSGTVEKLHSVLDDALLGEPDGIVAEIGSTHENGSGWRCIAWLVPVTYGTEPEVAIELRPLVPIDDTLELQRQVSERMLLSALRERGYAEECEDARNRLAFLAEAGRMLAESVDQTSTLAALTKLAIPTHGDWCIVDILEEENRIRRLGIYHSDPAKRELARSLLGRWNPDPADNFGAPAMLRGLSTVVITQGVDEAIAATGNGADNVAILHELGVGALLTVPLRARGKLLGAITFVSEKHQKSYPPSAIQLAEDIGLRAGLALDNAQTFEAAIVLRATAEKANEAKSAFLSAMGHELRTPLNAIGGYVDLLDMGLRGAVTNEQRADFARIKKNQMHLTALITEILNFARSARSGLPYSIQRVSACGSLKQAVELIEPLFSQNGILFDGVTGDDAIIAWADPERLTQILINLFANAIKFTLNGGRISAGCALDGDTVVFNVTDTGIGIEAGKLERIFEPFIQLKDNFAEREKGIGLGLAISRDLARAMNGDLCAESVFGEGSTFTLTLPIAAPA